jgi:hypothetical protein
MEKVLKEWDKACIIVGLIVSENIGENKVCKFIGLSFFRKP